MRSVPPGMPPEPPRLQPPQRISVPVGIDRHDFEQRARAELEQLLPDSSSQGIEPNAFVNLAWGYFVAGFAAGAGAETDSDEMSTRDIGASDIDPDTDMQPQPDTRVVGGPPCPVSTAPEQTPSDSADPWADMVAALTSRRLEVLRLVARGLTNREIAEVLGISSYTVKSHMAGLFESLDVTNRTEAAFALQRYDEVYLGEPPSH
jgi:DNA-binding CsgD family transcriptional regulator